MKMSWSPLVVERRTIFCAFILIFNWNLSFNPVPAAALDSASASSTARRRSSSSSSENYFDDYDKKLFLTPFLQAGKTREAREMSRVTNLCRDCGDEIADIESYSGFLTVNTTFNKNLFFYFVPALEKKDDTPLMIWLNGGPGSTSLLALFVEHGPFYLDENLKLQPRKITWTKTISIIYVDNPVRAGFSFTDNDDGLARTTEEAMDDLYIGLVQFLEIFEEYQTVDFYVAGQSYAGKYGPVLAHKIHQSNQNSPTLKINLKGLAIGSGFFDPRNQLVYSSFYYSTGLIDEGQRDYFRQQEELTARMIDAKNWTEAFIVLESLIIGYPTPSGISEFENKTGLVYNLNILVNTEPPENHRFESFLRRKSVRRALHVGNSKFSKFDPDVYNAMQADIYQSIRDKFVDLLNADYKILVYASQFDGIVPYATVNSFVNSLTNSSWKMATEYAKAERTVWRRSSNDVAGYVKQVGNFMFALIRNCGHLAPFDRPEESYDLINKFINS